MCVSAYLRFVCVRAYVRVCVYVYVRVCACGRARDHAPPLKRKYISIYTPK